MAAPQPMTPPASALRVPCEHPVDFTPPPRPPRRALDGTWCRLEPLDPDRHLDELAAVALAPDAEASWDYLPYGPFADRENYARHLQGQAASDDPLFFAVRDRDAGGQARGVLSLMRIVPAHGCIEIGHIWFAPPLQRTRAASEAVMRLAELSFELGYRRLEWKCNAANEASCRAARRFGFRFEGIFRRHMVVKGRNRDTAWFSIVAEEWPAIRAAYAAWRDPANFDADGRQIAALKVPD